MVQTPRQGPPATRAGRPTQAVFKRRKVPHGCADAQSRPIYAVMRASLTKFAENGAPIDGFTRARSASRWA